VAADIKTTLTEFFRCPECFINLHLKGEVSGEGTFFKFGDDTICYGRTSLAFPMPRDFADLHDVLGGTTIDGAAVGLPFDPTEVTNNLRLERYVSGLPGGQSPFLRKSRRDLYYLVRSLIPAAARRRLQKAALRDWRKRTFPRWPVDRTVETLHQRLLALAMKAQGIETIPFIWFWPNGARGCAIVTHDVETAQGQDFCSALMDLDDSFGVKSSFEVIPGARYRVSQEFVDGLRARGFEVAVQDLKHDGKLYRSRDGFYRQVREINRIIARYKARGFRAGGLYRNPEWYDALEASYDMSIPNVAHLDPQRGGCCTVFPYFIGRVLELPVTLTQDHSLFYILGDYSIELWRKQVALILEKNGLVSVIVHPDYVRSERAQRTYATLLEHLVKLRSDDRIWICLPSEVDAWWRVRRNLRLVNDQGRWRVEGEGKERAQVAYAILRGDEISYTIPGEEESHEYKLPGRDV